MSEEEHYTAQVVFFCVHMSEIQKKSRGRVKDVFLKCMHIYKIVEIHIHSLYINIKEF